MPMRTLRIALAQMNPTVGDIKKNAKTIVSYIEKAKKEDADLVVFPELSVTGYPPEDLLLKNQFVEDNLRALSGIQKHADTITAIVGFVDREEDIYNAAAVLSSKKLVDVYHKMYLPNYGVFDEYRYFQAGTRCPVYQIGKTWIGINICEDIWYPDGPARKQSLAGAELILNINASPYQIGKGAYREQMLSTRASDNLVVIAYLNTVGGQDELVFDGQSMILDHEGSVLMRGKQFCEGMVIADIDLDGVAKKRLHAPRRRQEVIKLGQGVVEKIRIPCRGREKRSRRKVPLKYFQGATAVAMDSREEVYAALVLGTTDYVKKNSFKGVLIGLSGGIDSALVATVAVEALGRENVHCLFMPSLYTSASSRRDVISLSRNLGVNLMEISVNAVFSEYLKTLAPHFQGIAENTTEENLQARIRGNLLMAFANKFGWLVLTTGNKSEMSVGYATLYGDMAGGFAVIKDVPKTMVYALCRWKNMKAGSEIIPGSMFSKAPSAELRHNQKDTDSLPPYEVLDPILRAYIEDDKSFHEIVSMGFSRAVVSKVIRMIDRSEYKRRQSPPGIKITGRAFGRDRRFPITNKYRGH